MNTRIAVFLTKAVGSMWCAYLFAALALISLPDAIHAGTAALISWTAQTFLQLVLLPVILVGGNVLSQKSEARAKQDHKMIMAELEILREINAKLGKHDD